MASAARNLVSRTIHIKMYPAARSLPERREVVRVLERFGEVEMFRSLKYDPINPAPNGFISILATEEAAQAALSSSPIRYRLVTESTPPPPSPPSAESPLDASSSSSTSSSTLPPPPHQPQPSPTFELRIFPSTYSHTSHIASSPLHSTFTPVSTIRSPIATDLFNRIPPSIARAGLIDWVTDSPKKRSGNGARGRGTKEDDIENESGSGSGERTEVVQWGRGGGTGWAGTKPWRLRDRERVKMEKDVPWAMKGLKSRPQDDPPT